jgi:DNA-binding NarL/FixJ family response regulator
MMPDVSGLDVLKSLDVHFPKIKCVVILSAASSFDLAESLNANVFISLRKPFDNAALIAAVRGCIDANCPVLPFPIRPAAAAA